MKILLVTENLGSGGAEMQLTRLAAMMKAAGHEPVVVTWVDRNFHAPFLAEHGVRHEMIGPCGRVARVLRLAKLMRRERPDAVISYLPMANETAILARLLTPGPKLLVSERSFTESWGRRQKITFAMYRMADAVVANSSNEADNIVMHCPKLRHKTYAIPNFVDTDRFHPTDVNKEGDPLRIVGVGRVIAEKNILNLLRGLAILRNRSYKFSFHWYGAQYDTGYVSQVRATIDELGLDDVFTLNEARHDIDKIYRSADIFCLPSVKEGYPNVLVEAMASGLPVATSNVCEMPRIVTPGIHGQLFNPDDPESIAEALATLLDLSSEARTTISAANRAYTLENNSKEAFYNFYTKLIDKTLKCSQLPPPTRLRTFESQRKPSALKRYTFLALYLLTAKWLPVTDNALPWSKFIKCFRSAIGKRCLDGYGKNVNIERGADFGTGKNIVIGNNSGIGINAKIRGPLSIGNDVMMGSDVIIIPQNHNSTRIDRTIHSQGYLPPQKIIIGDDVWIGSRTIFLPGAAVGSHSIVGAGAVVTKSFQEYTVIGGVPAKIIKMRK